MDPNEFLSPHTPEEEQLSLLIGALIPNHPAPANPDRVVVGVLKPATIPERAREVLAIAPGTPGPMAKAISSKAAREVADSFTATPSAGVEFRHVADTATQVGGHLTLGLKRGEARAFVTLTGDFCCDECAAALSDTAERSGDPN